MQFARGWEDVGFCCERSTTCLATSLPARRCRRRAPLVQQPGGDGIADGAARRLLRGRSRGLGGAGDGRLGRGPQVRDRGRGLRRAGRLHRALRSLPPDGPRARRADRRRRARQGGRPPRRGTHPGQGLRRVRCPPGLRSHPGPQRGGQEDRRRPRLEARGHDARPPAPRGSPRRRLRGLGRPSRRVPRRRRRPALVSDARAELIEDRGAAAAGEEFFRSRPFLEAEAVTHSLRVETDAGELLAPLIVRAIDGGPERDAISPYGYPGFAFSSRASDIDHTRAGSISDARTAATPQAPRDPATIDFSGVELVTVFSRHTLDEPPLGATSERNVVQIADPSLPSKRRGSDRNQINKNLRRGYELELVEGPRTTTVQRAGFLAAYEQTMRRTGAAERYFFGAAYFDRILQFARSWLALAHAPDGTIAAASIAAIGDGYLHYYLSGSA